MKRIYSRFAALLLGLSAAAGANAEAWPEAWEGVMLQGFYWDSYSDTRWTNLTALSDELSGYFRLIWVPNSGACGYHNNMGYMPQYWFSNHNSSFGTEDELRTMISTYASKGTGIIEDVVINHRNGVSDWADFPTETWDGRTWHIGLDGICRNDELAGSGHGDPTGAYDEGENFDGCRDLDHTNANVQDNCKNYCRFLLEDLGYSGFRYDMVKGYAGYYVGMYNKYSKPHYSVGEYWDGSYDKVAQWIEDTGKESAAFDFPFKYAVNEAFSSGDMSKLVWWEQPNNEAKPAGLIHHWYQRYAVTFIDNHDTYRDEWNRMNGNVVAANAFMLCSPGNPCVFLRHYLDYRDEIQRLIDVRNSVGLNNTSRVEVLRTDNSCYMAKVYGSKGDLVVKIGPAMVSPDGFGNDDIAASGNDYCIWTKVPVSHSSNGNGPINGSQGGGNQGGGNLGGNQGGSVAAPASLYLMGHLPDGAWETNVAVAMTKSGDKFTASNVVIEDSGEGRDLGYFSFVTTISHSSPSDWDLVNGSDRCGATASDALITVGSSAQMRAFKANVDASSAYSWAIAPGTYDITADFATMTVTVKNAGDGPDFTMPSHLYLMGDLTYGSWHTDKGEVLEQGKSGVFAGKEIKICESAGANGYGYFSLTTSLGTTNSSSEWDNTINGTDRFGAVEPDYAIECGTTPICVFKAGVNASSANSWAIAPGTYDITADLNNLMLTVTKSVSGIGLEPSADGDDTTEYYTLQGIRVDSPEHGLYIMVRNGKAMKVYK